MNPLESIFFTIDHGIVPINIRNNNNSNSSVPNTFHITSDNSNVLIDLFDNDSSGNNIDTSNNTVVQDISNNYHLLDVDEYQFIQNPINDICPITRERFYNNQNVLMIKNCGHIFNKSALSRWVSANNTCPSCRQILFNNIYNFFVFMPIFRIIHYIL